MHPEQLEQLAGDALVARQHLVQTAETPDPALRQHDRLYAGGVSGCRLRAVPAVGEMRNAGGVSGCRLRAVGEMRMHAFQHLYQEGEGGPNLTPTNQ